MADVETPPSSDNEDSVEDEEEYEPLTDRNVAEQHYEWTKQEAAAIKHAGFVEENADIIHNLNAMVDARKLVLAKDDTLAEGEFVGVLEGGTALMDDAEFREGLKVMKRMICVIVDILALSKQSFYGNGTDPDLTESLQEICGKFLQEQVMKRPFSCLTTSSVFQGLVRGKNEWHRDDVLPDGNWDMEFLKVVEEKQTIDLSIDMVELFPDSGGILASCKTKPLPKDIGRAMMIMMTIAHLSAAGKESPLVKFLEVVVAESGNRMDPAVYAMAQILLLDVDSQVRNESA